MKGAQKVLRTRWLGLTGEPGGLELILSVDHWPSILMAFAIILIVELVLFFFTIAEIQPMTIVVQLPM